MNGRLELGGAMSAMRPGARAAATRPPPPARVRSGRFVDSVAQSGRILDAPEAQRAWFVPRSDLSLAAGQKTPEPVTVPQPEAAKLLLAFVRSVADIPADANLRFVWEQGRDELEVDGASIGLTCGDGLVTVGLTVSCDQLPRPVRVAVPFAVGRADAPRGLLMATLDRVDAPAVVAQGWSEAITAFCWEALLELAQRVSAQVGNDSSGRPLIPGGLAANADALFVQPMARHDLSGLTA